MSRWLTVLATIAALCALLVLATLAFIYSGIYDIAAREPHWPITRWILETARNRSIEHHATGIALPPGLGEEATIIKGVEHFAEHCSVCHGAPGVPKGDIGKGLYPEPPELGHAATHYSEAELFWIIKNGIKMTGMPSWADHSDDEIWGTVAFIKKLPRITPEEYGKLIAQVMSHGGQHQPGGSGEKAGAHPAGPETGAQHEHGGAHEGTPGSK